MYSSNRAVLLTWIDDVKKKIKNRKWKKRSGTIDEDKAKLQILERSVSLLMRWIILLYYY